VLERVAWLVPTGAALVSAVLIVAAVPVLPAEVASQWNNDGPTSTMSPWGFLALPAIGLVVGLIGAGLAPGEPRGNAVIAIGVAFLLAVGFHHLVLRAERQSIPRSP